MHACLNATKNGLASLSASHDGPAVGNPPAKLPRVRCHKDPAISDRPNKGSVAAKKAALRPAREQVISRFDGAAKDHVSRPNTEADGGLGDQAIVVVRGSISDPNDDALRQSGAGGVGRGRSISRARRASYSAINTRRPCEDNAANTLRPIAGTSRTALEREEQPNAHGQPNRDGPSIDPTHFNASFMVTGWAVNLRGRCLDEDRGPSRKRRSQTRLSGLIFNGEANQDGSGHSRAQARFIFGTTSKADTDGLVSVCPGANGGDGRSSRSSTPVVDAQGLLAPANDGPVGHGGGHPGHREMVDPHEDVHCGSILVSPRRGRTVVNFLRASHPQGKDPVGVRSRYNVDCTLADGHGATQAVRPPNLRLFMVAGPYGPEAS